MPDKQSYDTVIIGAGMSGLAAGIRLAMYDKKVCILEQHSIAGGLNSYYKRGKREFDVGLHALTNFIKKGEKGRPLSKIIKQLRVPYDQFELAPQTFSTISYPDNELKFTNEIEFLYEEIITHFPTHIDSFKKLVHHIENYNETDLYAPYISARETIATFISSELLIDMIFCPLLIYGSALEHDMDFSQFAIMFKSIFLEGFSRPSGGVRRIINILLKKYKDLGGEILFKKSVKEIITVNEKVVGLLLENGKEIKTSKIISSAGLPETLSLLKNDLSQKDSSLIGKMSFTESIFILNKKPKDFGVNSTIIFRNDRPRYQYRMPKDFYDLESSVICLPNNFTSDDYEEGVIRITNIANYDLWAALSKEDYKKKKNQLGRDNLNKLEKLFPGLEDNIVFKDIFTPTTIKRYTGHFKGTVYGSPKKVKDGKTKYEGLYICGTDQGFLGIIGAMLSGISMANLHVLQE